jgi:polar amino acid transport system substrate-binding protein
MSQSSIVDGLLDSGVLCARACHKAAVCLQPAGTISERTDDTMVTSNRSRRLRGGLTAVVAASMLAAAACSANSDTTGSEQSATATVSATKVDAIAQMVPEPIRSSGQLVVGVTIPYAPNEFKDENGEIVGFDVDLMNAIADTLGLTPQYREADFAKIIPSIQQGTYNVGMASFTDNKEREQSVDFVTYFSAGTQWAQRPGSPVDPGNACGKKVAVQTTSVQDTEELPSKSKACVDAGKPAIEILKFDGQDTATNAVVLGQADAMSADSPVASYAIKQSKGKLEPAGEVFDSAPYGWPVAKGSTLAPALLKALEHLIETGDYQAIAANWGLENGVLDKPVINGAIG